MKSLALIWYFSYRSATGECTKRLPIIDMHLHAHYAGRVCRWWIGLQPTIRKSVFPGVDPRQPITLDRTISALHR